MDINKELLKSSFLYKVYDFARTKMEDLYLRILPPRVVISKEFKRKFGRELNWDNPRDLNEKINWLKIYSDTKQWTELSDKYKVRDFIIKKGLSDILVPLYAKWDKVDDIDFRLLPSSFVLKTNNGSGDIIVVKDKKLFDEKKVKATLKREINQRFGYSHGEPHYLQIKPCIIAEEYLEQKEDYSTSLVDYKIWSFDGKPTYIWACYSRSKDGVYVETHDLDWGYHPEKSVFTSHYLDGKGIVPKPKCLTRMIEIASILSEGIPQVRVDLYEINGKVYFGELTFTSNGGYNDFYTQDFLNELGDCINLPKII